MAKKAIYDVLESTIGRYVQNLDTSSLNVALWGGKIELRDLRIDVDAVNAKLARRAVEAPNLAAPFRVVGGKFDGLSVDVPWSKITSKPVVFALKGLVVLLEPWDHLRPQRNKRGGPGPASSLSAPQTPQRDERAQAVREADEARVKYNAVRDLTGGIGISDEDDDSDDTSSDDDGGGKKQKGGNGDESSSSGSSTFVSRLVRRIIENLQVEITGVRVELRGCGTSAGIVLDSLSLFSTDADGNRAFVDRSSNVDRSKCTPESFLHKALHISGLGLYCDERRADGDYGDGGVPGAVNGGGASSGATQPSFLSSLGTVAEGGDELGLVPSGARRGPDKPDTRSIMKSNSLRMSTSLSSGSGSGSSDTDDLSFSPPSKISKHAYILSPLSFRATLRQNDSTDRSVHPKYAVKSELSRLSVMLTRTQLESAHRISVAMTPRGARPLFPEYRPVHPVVGHASEWWKYAVRCIGRLTRRRSWTEFYLAFRKRKRYLELYRRHVLAVSGGGGGDGVGDTPALPPGLADTSMGGGGGGIAPSTSGPLSPSELTEMESIERDNSISVEGIMTWRNLVDASLAMERRKARRRSRARRRDAARLRERKGYRSASSPARPPQQQKQQTKRVKSSPSKKSSLLSSLFGSSGSSSGTGGGNGGAAGADSKEKFVALNSYDDDDEHDEPPITLTPEEMRELESVAYSYNDTSLQQQPTNAGGYPADSKLYDVQFALKSFKIDLIAAGMQTLTKLTMGTVGVTFHADYDGSLQFRLAMEDMRVDDMVTCKSLFPHVVRSLNDKNARSSVPAATAGGATASAPSQPSHAFEFRLGKTHSGDSSVVLKVVAFELVASSPLMSGIKDFFTLTDVAPAPCGSSSGEEDAALFGRGANPMLQESMSGSIDLFFDASAGNGLTMDGSSSTLRRSLMMQQSRLQHSDFSILPPAPSGMDGIDDATNTAAAAWHDVSDRLSAALADAWTEQRQRHRGARWTVDCDVHAPIIVVPESCTDPRATVVVLDLGRLCVRSVGEGDEKTSDKVREWMRPVSDVAAMSDDVSVEYWRMEMTNLKFLIGTCGNQDWGSSPNAFLEDDVNVAVPSSPSRSRAIIEPMSITLDVGMERRRGPRAGRDPPRTCLDGVLPAISVQISSRQVTRMLSLYKTWSDELDRIMGTATSTAATDEANDDDGGMVIIDAAEAAHSLSPGPGSASVKDPDGDALVNVDDEAAARNGIVVNNPSMSSAASSSADGNSSYDYVHVSLALRRLSVKIEAAAGHTDCQTEASAGEGIEAHLVSVVLSTSKSTDGSSSKRICMGWFWILDNLRSKFPRRQRLVMHSTLPGLEADNDADSAEEDEATTTDNNISHSIMDRLERQGVFEDGYGGSPTDLADITIITPPTPRDKKVQIGPEKEEETMVIDEGDDVFSNRDGAKIIDATFASLYVNWNPHAIKSLLIMQSTILDELVVVPHAHDEKSDPVEGDSSAVAAADGPDVMVQQSPRSDGSHVGNASPSGDRGIDDNGPLVAGASPPPTKTVVTTTIVTARMKQLCINLNSARDDLPLYRLTMSGTKLDLFMESSSSSTSQQESEEADDSEATDDEDSSSTIAFIEVGDFRMETPGDPRLRTLPEYRTMLGLAPQHSTSLLSVKYYSGRRGILSSGMMDSRNNCECCANVHLSPMRFNYVHAQVMTLVEYLTEGILGALAARVASSAAAAAIDLAQSVAGEKVFVVSATGFEFVVPEAAYTPDHFTIHAGRLDATYRSLANFAGSECDVILCDMTWACNKGTRIVPKPILLSVKVWLPPNHAPNEEDRAMRIDVKISRAAFFVTKGQYAQMMHLLTYNIGEVDSFLREELRGEEEDFPLGGDSDDSEGRGTILSQQLQDPGSSGVQNLTHAGVEEVVIVRRMYLSLEVEVVSLTLCGDDATDAIVELAAVQSHIAFRTLPDEERLCADFTLRNLVVEDRRHLTRDRYFRQLFSQFQEILPCDDEEAAKMVEENQDVFKLEYTKHDSGSTELALTVGSPQLTILPDLISEASNFIDVPADKEASNAKVKEPSTNVVASAHEDSSLENKAGVEVSVNDAEEEIETSVGLIPAKPATTTATLSIKTSTCKIVLVDIGDANLSSSYSGFRRSVSPSFSMQQLTETVVLQGRVDANIVTTKLSSTGFTVESDMHINADAFEVYTAQGKSLRSPVQIIEPASFSFYVTKAISPDMDGSQDVTLKVVTLSSVDISFSLQNAALLNAIMSSMSQDPRQDEIEEDAEKIENGGAALRDSKVRPLTDVEKKQVERLSFALQRNQETKQDSVASMTEEPFSGDNYLLEKKGREAPLIVEANSASDGDRTFNLHLTLPETNLTIINDFQGLDHPLFKVHVRNVICSGYKERPRKTRNVSGGSSDRTKFRFFINSSVSADYFDSSSNLWEELLLKPWETTLNFTRTDQHRFIQKGSGHRMSTEFDVESHVCLVSFSEQFLVSLGAAGRMWSVYSEATNEAKSTKALGSKGDAANAARNLVMPTPYGIDNQTGVKAYFAVQPKDASRSERRVCDAGCTEYFRFEYPRGLGRGGKRTYGQDVAHFKSLEVYIGSGSIYLQHIDAEVNAPRHAHDVGGGWIVFTDVVKTGKATVLRLRSRIHVHNSSCIPFGIAVQSKDGISDVGLCRGTKHASIQRRERRKTLRMSSTDYELFPDPASGNSRNESPSLGVPVKLLRNFVTMSPSSQSDAGLTIFICPFEDALAPDSGKAVEPSASAAFYDGNRQEKWGAIALPPPYVLQQMASSGNDPISTMDIICAPVGNSRSEKDSMIAQVCVDVTMVDDSQPFVEIYIRPRAVLENKLPVSILVRTPLAHTYSSSNPLGTGDSQYFSSSDFQGHTIHKLRPDQDLEVFTPGYSIPISAMCADKPIAGGLTGWLKGVWIDVPLGRNRLVSPVRSMFPFVGSGHQDDGIEVFIAEEDDLLKLCPTVDVDGAESPSDGQALESKLPTKAPSVPEHSRTVAFAVCNFAIDHTGHVLFERCAEVSEGRHKKSLSGRTAARAQSTSFEQKTPWSAFSCPNQRRRITLLPHGNVRIRLLQLTIDGSDGIRRSLPFKIDDISICEGGIESSAILWENNTKSGYFAYRRLVAYNQSEVHIIPEFVVFNGGSTTVLVKQFKSVQCSLVAGKMGAVSGIPNHGLILSLDFPIVSGGTANMRIDSLGLKICVVKSSIDGAPLGSVAVQTVVGALDSRVVVKIGDIKFGGQRQLTPDENETQSMFENDILRLRVRWSRLELTLNDTQERLRDGEPGVIEAALDRYTELKPPKEGQKSPTWAEARRHRDRISFSHAMVAQIKFVRFTVDYQRIFRDMQAAAAASTARLDEPERSQLSVIVHNMMIIDCTPQTPCPVVFESDSNGSFLDLCIRFRGRLDAEMVKVDLITLNLAHSKEGQSNRIIINTSEDFIWRVLDVSNRILMAISEVTGVNFEFDPEDYESLFMKGSGEEDATPDMEDGEYSPPQSDKLFDIRKASVSPVTMLVSFKRQPQTSRYKMISGVRGAKLLNYFTRQLKFTVDKAELNFAGYIANDIRGPPDRFVEMLTAVYVHRMKYQLVSLMGSMSIQEWKSLAAREDGSNEYVEGDILRTTGNILGRSAGYVFKKVGQGVGDGVIAVTSGFGEGVENVTEVIGAGAVGAGVNSVVSGLGDGVGTTLKGVGRGASHFVKGTGKGVGQIAGGLGGGVQLAAKGIGKGVTTGDGRAILTGVSDGAASVRRGVGQGIETAFLGTTDGVFNVTHGLVSGINSVGRGIGGAFTGGRGRREKEEEEEKKKRRPRLDGPRR